MPTPIVYVRCLAQIPIRAIPILVGLAIACATAMGQTATDPCGFTAGAKWTVNASCTPSAFNKPGGFVNDMIPAGCNANSYNDAFAWFAGTGNPVIVKYAPQATADAILHVLGGTCAAPTVLGCSDNCCGGAVESVTIPTILGTNYIIRVQRYGGNTAMNGTLCVYSAPPPPANDEPCNAITVPVNPNMNCTSQTAGTLVNATPTPLPAAPCFGTPDNDVWFKFTATNTTQYINLNNVAGNTTDLYHAVYSGTCGNLTNILCSDPDNSFLTGLTIGQTYWVRVYSYYAYVTGDVSTFNICITSPLPPPTCGQVFYDPGGSAANYPNSHTTITTLCPANPGDKVVLNFTAFSTEPGIDILSIYDGNSVAAPLIGTYSGASLPPVIIATNASGCLTASFSADASINDIGWAANVSCMAMPAGNCVYLLRLFDSAANGWGSSSVGVRINGGPWTYYTVTGNSTIALVGVNIGQLIEVTYNASGPNQNQNSYTISKLGQLPYFSSASPPVAGITYSQTVTCGPPPAQPQDCAGGITVCGNQNISNKSSGPGQVADLNASNRGCLSGENQGTWYYFSAQTNGSIAFTITPANGTDDYDFAVWGPYANAQCPSGPPLRCSYDAPPPYSTGLNASATQTTEGAAGTGWVKDIQALAGQVYVLYIDNFSATGQAFTLTWQLTNSNLDCTVLPVELIALEAIPQNPVIDVIWATATEQNSHHFNVQRSADNSRFATIGSLPAAGNAQFRSNYQFVDQHPFGGLNYYRLEQVDNDGTIKVSHTVTAILATGQAKPVLFPNPTKDVLHVDYATIIDGNSTLSILDALGRCVLAQPSNAPQGQHSVSIPIEGLAPGWYSLRIRQPDGSILNAGGFMKQ